MKNVTAVLFGLAIMAHVGTAYPASWSEIEDNNVASMDNRSVNAEGLTGLIRTVSAYTQPKGSIILGFSGSAENSRNPDFSSAQVNLTATAGLTGRIEVGVKAQVAGLNLGSSSARQTGVGDTEVFAKMRLTDQYDTFPALAIGVGYTFPTGDEVKGTGSMKNQGARLILAATNEKEIPGGYAMGIYVDGQILYNDEFGSKTVYTDKYGRIDVGLLVTLDEERRLHGIVEWNYVAQKDIPTVFERNSWAVMPGLRYVTEHWNVTGGVQFIHPKDDAASNDMRALGTISYTF